MWQIPEILALGMLIEEDCKFKTSLGYMARHYLKPPSKKPYKMNNMKII